MICWCRVFCWWYAVLFIHEVWWTIHIYCYIVYQNTIEISHIFTMDNLLMKFDVYFYGRTVYLSSKYGKRLQIRRKEGCSGVIDQSGNLYWGKYIECHQIDCGYIFGGLWVHCIGIGKFSSYCERFRFNVWIDRNRLKRAGYEKKAYRGLKKGT